MAIWEAGILKPVGFREYHLWDVKRYMGDQVGWTESRFPLEPLADHVVVRDKKVRPFQSPAEDFGILGVGNKTGLFDACIKKGSNLKQPYKVVEDGSLVYNPYRVNVGSVGLKTRKQVHRYISPAYVVFRCRRRLLPEFLLILFKTDRFKRQIRYLTTGSVRETLSFKRLSQMSVSVPGIDTQERLVEMYNRIHRRAGAVATRVSALEKKIEAYLIKELELEIGDETGEGTGDNEGTHLVQFEDLDRWSVSYCLNRHILETGCRSKYPLVRFGDIVESSRYGISRKASKEKVGKDVVPVLRMSNIFDSELVPDDLKYIERPFVGAVSLLERGDLLFNRTNSKELVGKTAVFNEDGDYTFASYLIRVRLSRHRADVEFINYLFNSDFLRKQVEIVSRQTLGQANVNARELKEFLVPLPPLEVQGRIVSTMSRLRKRLNGLRREAAALRREALTSFEKALFL